MDQPNILFILIDDMGWKDLVCYGSDFYETPNIDRLAREGMLFTDAYAACPVCSPTRASLLSGQYPARVGVTDWIDWGNFCHPRTGKVIDVPYTRHLPLTNYTLASALREGGYRAWHVGKWHLGPEDYYPDRQGFEANIGGCEWGLPMRGYFSPWHIPTLDETGVPEGTYLPDYLTDKAIALIRENQGRGRPFYLNMWYYLVHMPAQAPEPLVEKYRRKAERLGIDQEQALVKGEPMPYDERDPRHVVRRIIQSDPKYAAMIEALDTNVGKFLAVLDELGEADNTAILFTSDNGGLSTAETSPTCNAPLSEGKGWMYEGGTREPLLVRWPGRVAAGSRCAVPITSPDFYPTFLAMAGLEPIPEQHVDGVSFLPLLEGADSLDREAIYWHYPHYGNQGGTPGSSIRAGDWKLIEFFEEGRLELYNLKHDIAEHHNLADATPAKRDELHAKLKAWRESVEAKLPQPNPNYGRR